MLADVSVSSLVQHEKELRAPDDFYDGSLAKESEEKEA